MNEQELCKKKLIDLSRQANRKGIVLFSDFLNLNELNIYHQNEKFFETKTEASGGVPFAERQIVAFIPDALYYEWQFPIAYLEIVPSYPKFAEKFTTGFLLLPRLVVRRITPFAPFTPYTAVAEASFNTEID